ncbi:GNAT family N-acetyltransferase [Nocardia testacea]|uniref:GNAT family N-acetyltransferase n=1 Tax=Nocardia testacea TaxID=248551 RepID=A0ABW7W6P3_9NOCA
MAPIPFPDPPLRDDQVELRPWRESDLPHRFRAFADPLCRRFSWPLTEPLTEAHVWDRFAAEEPARQRGEELCLAITDAADPADIRGGASVYDVGRSEGRMAIGYWLAPHARGRGIATRTLRLLAGWAFDALAVARLELTCGPDNLASQRVALRCGFVREGLLRSHIPYQGARRDTVVFGLLPGELT